MNHLTILELYGCVFAGMLAVLFVALIPFLVEHYLFLIEKMRNEHRLWLEKEMTKEMRNK